MKLTNKRKVFIEEYLQCWNATKAARRAGYRHPHVMGNRLIKVKEIAAIIEARLKEKAMSSDEVLARMAAVARFDISEFVTDVPGKPSSRIDFNALMASEKSHVVKSIVPTKEGDKIEFYDSLAALNMIGKHHRLFADRIIVDDWRSELIDLLRKGEVEPEQIQKDFPSDLAAELFAAAGVSISEA